MPHDVVIVGGGPAGATLGTILVRSGVSCCIVDKSVFPREKLCGGLVTHKAKRLAETLTGEIDLYKAGATPVRDVALLDRGELVTEIRAEHEFHVVRRSLFDHILIRRFLEAGGVLYEGERAVRVDIHKNTLCLDSGRVLPYRILAGADGIYSVVRRDMRKAFVPDAFCCETFVSKSHANLGAKLEIDIGAFPYGYAWVFPGKDAYAVGVGGLLSKCASDRKKALLDFCRRRGIQADSANSAGEPVVRGHHLPSGTYVRNPVRENVLLIGDAAGLADSITGEGIYYALRSAELAASCIRRHIDDGREGLGSYTREISEIHAAIDSATRLQRIFYHPAINRRVMSIGRRHGSLAKHLVDTVISTGDSTWCRAIARHYAKKIGISL